MQGPYVYALYESYGYKPQAIGQLFIAGFGSSLLFGTIAGALADKACVVCLGSATLCLLSLLALHSSSCDDDYAYA